MSSTFRRSPREQKRVVITGIGLITPVGLTTEESWKSLLEGRSGIGPITKFDSNAYDVRFAGEVKSFLADSFVPKKEQKKMDTFIQYSVACTHMALQSSGLPLTPEVIETTGVMIGSGMGGLPLIEEAFQKNLEKGPSRISPFFIPSVITNMASGQVSIQWGFQGVGYSVTSACATGAHSIGEAYRYIRDGISTCMIAGGTESTVCPLAIGGFAAMRALSTKNENPQGASRPFDRDRDGFVLSEGCAVLVLEEYEFAKKRGAPIICEVRGYGTSSDAYHMTSPAPEGAGAAKAVVRALADAELNPDQIQYVNAHGTSTPVGDELETLALKKVFGEHSRKLMVSSTKSMMGHTLGAAGAIEASICALSLRDQKVPPTINLDNPSPGCDLDYVPKQARDARLENVVNNSFGFGGTNACLVLSRC